jgi:hypothetical protein
VVTWLRTRFAGYAELVGELLAGITEANVQAYPHVLHRVPARWGSGPTTLLGDAKVMPFWRAVLGYRELGDEDPVDPHGRAVLLVPGDGRTAPAVQPHPHRHIRRTCRYLCRPR